MTITVHLDQGVGTEGVIAAGPACLSDSGHFAEDIPQMIPKDELLFWTAGWRELEDKALSELESGESHEFENFRDLAIWLLRSED